MTEQQRHPPLILEPEQYAVLTQLATQQHQSISEVAVEVVRLGLETLRQRSDVASAKQRQRLPQKALKRLKALREEIQQAHGIYPGDLVMEVRAEREEQIERIIAGEL